VLVLSIGAYLEQNCRRGHLSRKLTPPIKSYSTHNMNLHNQIVHGLLLHHLTAPRRFAPQSLVPVNSCR
jgi:hypothetical protein